MIGERIRLAREACCLTQQELADSSGVPLGTIGSIEAGRIAVPSDSHMERIASVTGFPLSFFSLGPLPDMPEGFYRKLKRGQAKADKQLRAQVRQVIELVQRAEGHVNLPPVAINPINREFSLEDIEEIARDTRNSLGVGRKDPIPSLIRAVERAGIIVVRLPTIIDFESYSVWPDFGLGGRPVIALTGDNSGDRDRATLGHELGHLVLHVLRNQVDPDKAEKEAWRFAGAILLPREAAEEAMRLPVTLRVLMEVKTTFGTSIAFNAQRAFDLNLITKAHFVSLRKQLHARGWYKNEPVEVVPEKPLLISRLLDHLSGTGSFKDRAERVHMSVFQLKTLAV